jgi:hypothetical protein
MGDIDLSTEKELITQRECEIQVGNLKSNFNTLKIDTEKFIKDIGDKVDKLEGRFWWIITLLLINLASIIVLLIKK